MGSSPDYTVPTPSTAPRTLVLCPLNPHLKGTMLPSDQSPSAGEAFST